MSHRKSSAGGARNDSKSAALTSPFTGAHAIVFADFGLSVRKGFSKRSLASLQAAMEGPLLEDGFRRLADSDCGGSDQLRFGYERLAPGVEQEVVETVHVHAGHVHVLLHEYRGWEVTRQTAMKRLGPVLDFFRASAFDARLVLAFRDAFVNKTPRRYSPLDVFKPNSLLPMTVFEVGEFWHQQLTLVDDAAEGEEWERIFSRLSVEARVRRIGKETLEEGKAKKSDFVHWTEITHRQQLVGNRKAAAEVEWSDEVVAARLDVMHRRNKVTMLELLSHEMLERIGLTEKTP